MSPWSALKQWIYKADGTPHTTSDGEVAGNIQLSAGAMKEVFPTQTGNATPDGVPFGRMNANFESTLIATTAASCTLKLYGTNEAGDKTNGKFIGDFSLSLAAAGTAKAFGSVTRPYLEVYGVITGATGTITSIDFNWVG